jgi:hypothetical protein
VDPNTFKKRNVARKKYSVLVSEMCTEKGIELIMSL